MVVKGIWARPFTESRWKSWGGGMLVYDDGYAPRLGELGFGGRGRWPGPIEWLAQAWGIKGVPHI